jgi:hypothetical protein
MSDTATTPVYGANEDAEYLNIAWGILRTPVVCAICDRRTRLPYPSEDGPICGGCYRVATYGY